MEGSKSLHLNSQDMKKVGKGLIIAMVGAGLTYLASAITQIDFGTWTPLVVAGFSFATNFVRKWLKNNS